MADVFSIYTPDVPDNAPTPCMRDPIRLFDIVFILSIVVWFPSSWWKRGTHLHDTWVASVIAIFSVHVLWLMSANAAGQPSEDKWEYGVAAIAFFLAIAGKSLIASCIPYMVVAVTGFYGLGFVYSLDVHSTDIMTVLLVLLAFVSLAMFPLTVYILNSPASDIIKDLLDLAFRTVLMVSAIKFLILQEGERDGTVCCTISRNWQLTTNCPLSVPLVLIFACVGVFLARVGFDIYRSRRTRQQDSDKKETQTLLPQTKRKEEDKDDDDSSAE